MATNNLLVNNERKVLYDQQSKVERSGHNLSQSRKFPCDVGYIYPFFCRKTLPSDSFKISADILIKQLQPLLVPQMVSFTVNTAFYWVDYSLAFPEFEYFLINQRGSQDIELPFISEETLDEDKPNLSAISSQNLGTNLRSFLDITVNNTTEKIDALPFWTYQTIIRDFYLNIDRLSESEYNTWFPSDASEWKLKQGLNYKIGVQSASTGIDPFLIRSHNVRGDYFVNSYPTPLRGDVPSLLFDTNVSDLTAELSANLRNATLDLSPNTIELDDKSIYFDSIGGSANANITTTRNSPINTSEGQTDLMQFAISPVSGAYTNLKYFTGNVFPSGSSNTNIFSEIQSEFNGLVSKLRNSSYSGSVSLSNLSNLSTSISVTTRQLRLLESLTRKREIDIMMKPRLKNYLQTYFGVNRYKDDSLYQPVFIGSTSQQILINDIAQTTATSDSPLGRQGATAMSLGSGYVGEYYCRNYGCLMGVMYILPDYDYEPAIPREWQERTPDDFVNPEFTHLSMQPILNKELFVSSDNTWNNEVLGYMGMYDNYRTSQNLVAGDFLNSNYGDVRQFAQVRRFDNSNKPEITTQFLDSNTAFDRTVFATPSLPPFIAQCVARVESVRPLPQIAIPRA